MNNFQFNKQVMGFNCCPHRKWLHKNSLPCVDTTVSLSPRQQLFPHRLFAPSYSEISYYVIKNITKKVSPHTNTTKVFLKHSFPLSAITTKFASNTQTQFTLGEKKPFDKTSLTKPLKEEESWSGSDSGPCMP